jgi:hypothetical protein
MWVDEMATFFRGAKGRVNSVTGQFGMFIQQVFWKRKSKAIEKKRKHVLYSVDL